MLYSGCCLSRYQILMNEVKQLLTDDEGELERQYEIFKRIRGK